MGVFSQHEFPEKIIRHSLSGGADKLGMTEDEMAELEMRWRESNPKIVKFWHDLERCAKEAIQYCTKQRTHGLTLSYEKGFLFIELPRGDDSPTANQLLG